MKKILQKLLATMIPFVLLSSYGAGAQQKVLSGVVVNAEGKGVPSATIQVAGTKETTVTSEDGKFSIKAAPGQRLEISSIGYASTTFVVGSENNISISLKNSGKELGEVVVTALGISRQKRELGYSVQDVGGAALSEVKPTNVVSALSGKVAGVQITTAGGAVGSSARIVIRGNHSFGQNEPLWVVDGTPFINFSSNVDPMYGQDYGNGALDLDPDNIESISVLKGANATALYGSRGANGVVLVTTKKGSREKNKLGIDIITSTSIENPYILPKWQNEYGGGNHGSEYYWKKDHPTMTYQDFAKAYGFNWVDGYGGGVNDNTPKSWGPRLDVGLKLDQFTGKDQPWISRPNNMKDFFQTGITNDNSIALSKSSDVGSMRVFLANNDVKGTVPNTDYFKYTASFSGDLNLSKRLTAGVNMTYVNNHSNNLPSQGYNGGGDNAIASFVFLQRQVDMKALKDNWDKLDANGHPYSFAQAEMNNPYADAHNNSSQTRNRLYGNANMKLKMTGWLSVMGRIGTDYYNEERKKILRSISYDGNGTGKFWQSQQYAQETNADVLFLFDKQINDNFHIDGTAGANYRIETSHQMRMDIDKLTVPDLFTVANVSGNPSVSQYDSKKVTNSVLGSVNVSFKNYLFLGVTGRNDWSSSLPKNSWSYFYPSVSTGFVFTDAFNIKSDVLSYGKIRASYAEVGNDTGPYNVGLTYSSVGGGPWNGTSLFYLPGQLPPVSLKPEKTKSLEGGFNLKFFKDRVGIDLSVYDTKTTNQIMSVDIATSTGYNNALINAGEIENKGVELVLNGTPISNKNFSWDVTVNWARNHNRVNKLYGDLESLFISSMWLATVEARPGQPYGVIYGKGLLRDAKGQIIVNNNGLPQLAPTNSTWGNVTPDWVGGISNTLTYKAFSLYFLIDGRKGGDIISGTKLWGTRMGNTALTVANNVRETGIIVPGVKANGTPNDIRVSAQDYFNIIPRGLPYILIDGSYAKLRELSIRYHLPKTFTSKIGIYSASIEFFGRNLALLYTDKSNDIHIDPETGFGTGNQGVGFEQMQIPSSRSLGVKLSVSL